jgi:hypothetical protein
LADSPEADIVRTAQMMAQGYLIDLLLAAHIARQPRPGEAADQLLQVVEAGAPPFSLPGMPAALRDLAAETYRDTLVKHIQRARSLATGEPFEPGSLPEGEPSRQH